MHLETIMSELADRFGMEFPGVSDHGACSLEFKGLPTVYVVESDSPHQIRLVAVIGNYESCRDKQQLFRNLLKIQMLGIQTHGAFFSVDEDRSEIVLFRCLEEELTDVTVFTNELESFLDTLEEVTSQVMAQWLSPGWQAMPAADPIASAAPEADDGQSNLAALSRFMRC